MSKTHEKLCYIDLPICEAAERFALAAQKHGTGTPDEDTALADYRTALKALTARVGDKHLVFAIAFAFGEKINPR